MIVGPIQVVMLPAPTGHQSARSEGVHVSSIIRCIALEMGILKTEWIEELTLVETSQADWWESLDEVSRLRIAVGLAWEQWYLPQLQTYEGIADHPGEICLEGIYMTPDGEDVVFVYTESFNGHVLRIHEVKFTYKSIKTVCGEQAEDGSYPDAMKSQWMWVSQGQAYCKGRNTRFHVQHVFFACGDYTFPIRPKLLRIPLEYTQEEVDTNWSLLRDYRDTFKETVR